MLTDSLLSLSAVVRELADADELDDMLQLATDAAVGILPADHASIRVCTSGDGLTSAARSGVGTAAPPASFAKGKGVMGWAALTGKVARVGDVTRDDRFVDNPERGFDVRSIMSIPIVARKRVLGVLSVSGHEPDAFGAEQENVGVVLAHMVGQALNAAELSRLATTDSLTHAYNRSYLLPCLGREVNRSQREGKAFSVALMDLDHFKKINDRFGHSVGDMALVQFSEMVQGCVRSFDVLIRRGGEEFELVMPTTTEEEAIVVAERIRLFLADHPLRVGGNLAIPQTVSIGVATWDGREGPGELDERADAALYEAKNRGRNRTVVAARSTMFSN